ncbi:22159_t:CDS:1, partial [Rhizophagus irregularis]
TIKDRKAEQAMAIERDIVKDTYSPFLKRRVKRKKTPRQSH